MYGYQNLLLCTLLLSLGYPYTIEYKEVLLTTVSTNYTAYQSLFIWFTKSFCFEKKILSIDRRTFRKKFLALSAKEKFSRQKKNSHIERKIPTAKEQFSRQKKNSQSKIKILKAIEKFSRQNKNLATKQKFSR